MKNRTKQKTVQSVEEKKAGLFGRFTNIFKTKTKTKTEKTRQKKKNKNGDLRKETAKTTELQVRKIFRIHSQNPHLSTCDIGKTVGMSDELVKYYLKKGKLASIQPFKLKRDLQKEANDLKIKQSSLRKRQRNIELGKDSYEKSPKGKATRKAYQQKQRKKQALSFGQAQENIERLFKKEKYPVEHQGDPEYFKGSNPPQVIATAEAFKDQKRRNNINRVNTAKMLSQAKEAEVLEAKQSARHVRIKKSHEKNPPKIHYACCSYCNPKSHLTDKEYDTVIHQEAWKRHQYAEKQKTLLDKEKELDKRKQDELGSVADLAEKGTQLCRKCDQRIPYSQATRSFSIYGEYYCVTHEPKV